MKRLPRIKRLLKKDRNSLKKMIIAQEILRPYTNNFKSWESEKEKQD